MPQNRFVMRGHQDVSPPATPTKVVHHKDELKRSKTLRKMKESLGLGVRKISNAKLSPARSGRKDLVPLSEEAPSTERRSRPPPSEVSLGRQGFPSVYLLPMKANIICDSHGWLPSLLQKSALHRKRVVLLRSRRVNTQTYSSTTLKLTCMRKSWLETVKAPKIPEGPMGRYGSEGVS